MSNRSLRREQHRRARGEQGGSRPRRPGKPAQARRWWRAIARPQNALFALPVVVVAGFLAFLIYTQAAAPLPGTKYPSLGNSHFDTGKENVETANYNTDPPTSGPHWGRNPVFQIYDQPIPKEWQPHFLEHGGVLVQYTFTDADATKALQTLVNGEYNKGIGQLALAPYPTMNPKHAIALTAWQYLEYLDPKPGETADAAWVRSVAGQLRDFIERHECHYDPEAQCGPAHGSLKPDPSQIITRTPTPSPTATRPPASATPAPSPAPGG